MQFNTQNSNDRSGPGQVTIYTCSFCKGGFSNAQALGGHMNTHRRDRAKLKQSSEENYLLSLDISIKKTILIKSLFLWKRRLCLDWILVGKRNMLEITKSHSLFLTKIMIFMQRLKLHSLHFSSILYFPLKSPQPQRLKLTTNISQ